VSNGPLNIDQVKNSYRQALLNIEVTVKDKNGNPVTLSPDPSNGSILVLADAMAEALVDVLKNQVLVSVAGGQPVQVNTGTGTGTTLPQGSGTIK
jgi:hypothetical protein